MTVNDLLSQDRNDTNPTTWRIDQKTIEYKGQQITTVFHSTKPSIFNTMFTNKIVKKYLKKFIRVSRLSSSSSSYIQQYNI